VHVVADHRFASGPLTVVLFALVIDRAVVVSHFVKVYLRHKIPFQIVYLGFGPFGYRVGLTEVFNKGVNYDHCLCFEVWGLCFTEALTGGFCVGSR
jgi:hypothetical protein